jgi:hypothetical protein
LIATNGDGIPCSWRSLTGKVNRYEKVWITAIPFRATEWLSIPASAFYFRGRVPSAQFQVNLSNANGMY